MSGGSYDYLCLADDLSSLAEKRFQLERMRDRLAALPWGAVAAVETQRVITMLNIAEARVSALDGLRDVWKAIEWWDSADWSATDAMQTCRHYEERLGASDDL